MTEDEEFDRSWEVTKNNWDRTSRQVAELSQALNESQSLLTAALATKDTEMISEALEQARSIVANVLK
ncbi:hypothetical protein [Cryobacterium sp. TMT4-10]|uniref:hypothetical protein n=1 Tax=Cryobacterium sp. TMT4-10 TaxID=1259256 RepID=UPI00106CAB71|nr:hypothetical protein [Cryobacterium sp. TMT4-10]TFD16790.1 hypothetical protein E3T42_08765 [Cryobacterium sp. TMT4-10]